MESIISRLGDSALQQASSPKIFERGRTYAASGAVTITAEESSGPEPTIQAHVAGTATYTVSVWIADNAVDGSCNCINASEGWFCKHQVAVALLWRHRLSGAELVLDETARKKVQASAKRAQTARDRRDALHEFLQAQAPSVLVQKLTELADAYREIERDLQQWRKISAAQEQPQNLKSLVADILAFKGEFLPLSETWPYVRRAEALLPLLQQARARDAQAAAPLALHAMRRIWAVLMKADDSNGEIGNLARLAAVEWVAALQAAGPQPAAFGETYLRVQLDDPFGSFDAEAVETAMGEVALYRYQSLLEKLWRQALDVALSHRAERDANGSGKRSAGYGSRSDESEMELRRVERLHLMQLERKGDLDGALAVLRSDVSDPRRLGEVTVFLERHGRLREAFANAEKACQQFPDDRWLQDALIRCYERDGYVDEAYRLLRKQFEHSPSVAAYRRVLEAGAAAQQNESALRQELLSRLATLEEEAMRAPGIATPFRFARRRPAGEPPARNVTLRAQILCSEQRWREAIELVQLPSMCHPDTLRHIALNLDATERKAAVALLTRVFELAIRTASTPYRQELALVVEIAERLDPEARTAWLAGIRLEFKAKRNFVRDLPKM